LHAAVNYCAQPLELYFFKDNRTWLGFDCLVDFIHCFRMPTFFALSGFLSALMCARKGRLGLLKNRVRRILLPFVLAWLVVFPVCAVIVQCGYHRFEYGTLGIDWSLTAKYQSPRVARITTTYLWFLHYLFMFCVLTILVDLGCEKLGKNLRARLSRVAARLSGSLSGCLALSLPLLIAAWPYAHGSVEVTGSFIPDVRQLLYYGTFFGWGWLSFRVRGVLGHDAPIARYVALAVVAFAVSLCAEVAQPVVQGGKLLAVHSALLVSFTLSAWCWSLVLVASFERSFSSFNPVWRYLADSSYWIYLLHMLLTSSAAVLMYGLPWHPLLKFTLNLSAAVLISLLSYRYCVRNTVLGQLLNGRRYPPGVRAAS
jgi:glucans biosynthesis protein C